MLRYAGFGVLQPRRALDILGRDAQQPEPYVPWLSLYRLGLAYGQVLPNAKRDEVGQIARFAVDLVSATEQPDNKASELLPAAIAQSDDREPLTYARNWKTTVTPNVDGVTEVVSEMELKAPFNRVAVMCDPRQWQNVSLFWYESKPVKGAPLGPTPSIDDPHARPQPWSGILQETVAGMGILTVRLGVDYKVEEGCCTVDYRFESSPDSNLRVDNGTMVVQQKDDGWLYSRVVKRIDFDDAPFGGPSSADLLAPSFIGTWMRVQQDFLAARATGWQQPSATSLHP